MNKDFPVVPIVVGLVVAVLLVLAYLSDSNAREIDQHKFDVCIQSGKSYHNGSCQ